LSSLFAVGIHTLTTVLAYLLYVLFSSPRQDFEKSVRTIDL
jgi:hypothetical protein